MTVAIGTAAVAAALLGATPAFAQAAYLGDDWASSRVGEDYRIPRVGDRTADGEAVAGKYFRLASPTTERTLWNKSGSGTTVTGGDGSSITTQKVCRQATFTDPCSGWVNNY
ncbi:hypothetical protein ACFYO0_38735 [Streptomyces sp. NPDC006365]|uniref:hypothetical protein n=1 Tax=Streptomyces sp. NPDC006365 TaxID=3364744 RepID=UPI00369095B9